MDPEQLKALEAERGKVYGPPLPSFINIGLAWTALIQQHYGITLPTTIPAHLVAQMMVAFKNQRSVRVYKKDNFDDLHVYADFADRFMTHEAKSDTVYQEEIFRLGDNVSKVGGDYRFDGIVTGIITKKSGCVRYSVEDDRGILHIYSAKNLTKQNAPTPAH